MAELVGIELEPFCGRLSPQAKSRAKPKDPAIRERREDKQGFSGRIGGASRDRTDDLIVANDALSQLSYSPTLRDKMSNFTSLGAAYKTAHH